MDRFSRFLLLICMIAADTGSANAARSLQDYRYFRALSIDLTGRLPTDEEIARFERDDFDLGAWLDARMAEPAYADRVARIYMDLLRLKVGEQYEFQPPATRLFREWVLDEKGKPVYVFFRERQRRRRPETDGSFCFTRAEAGFDYIEDVPTGAMPPVTKIPISREVLDRNTVVVRPWWLYGDYRSPSPRDLYNPTTWAVTHPGFIPVDGLVYEMDGKTPVVEVRVCREEAQAAATGRIYTTSFAGCHGPAPYGRVLCPPVDSGWALQHSGETVSCDSAAGAAHSPDCGCGVGLERCLPNDADYYNSNAFDLASLDPLGFELPFDRTHQRSGDWLHLFLTEEVTHFLQMIFARDRDVRELLTARDSVVNGPLVQFYKHDAPAFGPPAEVSFTRPAPMGDLIDSEYDQLANPATLPDLLANDLNTWAPFPDRGPVAAGFLTMPAFLVKYGSRRGRAHTIYSTFLCRDFIAPPDLRLPVSNDPDLTRRPGCATCHAQLEPLAAYFARTMEFSFQYFSRERFPNFNPLCAIGAPLSAACYTLANYDPTFSMLGGMQRAAYASARNADAGPAGLAAAITADPEFATCMARRVASSLLGRPLGTDDEGLVLQYTAALVAGQYRMRALVRAVLLSDAYRGANDLVSSAWREGRP